LAMEGVREMLSSLVERCGTLLVVCYWWYARRPRYATGVWCWMQPSSRKEAASSSCRVPPLLLTTTTVSPAEYLREHLLLIDTPLVDDKPRRSAVWASGQNGYMACPSVPAYGSRRLGMLAAVYMRACGVGCAVQMCGSGG